MKRRRVIITILAASILGLVASLAAVQAGTGRWVAVSPPGFGDLDTYAILALTPFGQHLYAGTEHDVNGGDLWRTASGADWEAVSGDGFGDSDNIGIEHLAVFKNQLYAGTLMAEQAVTKSAQIWRSGDGQNWTQVTPPGLDATQKEIGRLAVFKDHLYAATWSYTETHGCELWRSNSGAALNWTRVVSNGFGDANNIAILSTEVFNDRLYVGTFNMATGGEVWRSDSGAAGSWAQVNSDGFGGAAHFGVSALAAFDGYLYASTRPRATALTGIQVWRCQACDGSDWSRVVDNGFGDPTTNRGSGMIVLQGSLYLLVGNRTSGLQAWRSADGVAWQNVGRAGLVGPNNLDVYFDNTLALFGNTLFVGTTGDVLGLTSRGQVLRYWPDAAYLPVVRKSS